VGDGAVPLPVVRATIPALAPPQGTCPAPRRARRGQRLRRQGRTLRELAELGEGPLLQLPDALPAQAEHVVVYLRGADKYRKLPCRPL